LPRAKASTGRIAVAACLAALAVAAGAPPASATVTIGSSIALAPTQGQGCAPRPCTFSQAALPGRTLVSSVNGTVVRWRVNVFTAGSVRLRVLRPVGMSTHFAVSGPVESLAVGTHSLPTALPIMIGDRIGVQILEPGNATIGSLGPAAHPVPGAVLDFWHSSAGGPPDGSTVPPTHVLTQIELFLSADIEPTSQFSLAGVTRNKRNGTATITAQLPNAGELTASGNGVKVANRAASSVSVAAPGTAQLVIRAQGKKKKKLKRKGKVTVAPSITFTPTNGTSSTQTTTLKLRKKRKRRR
jgi:hypothetical protein